MLQPQSHREIEVCCQFNHVSLGQEFPNSVPGSRTASWCRFTGTHLVGKMQTVKDREAWHAIVHGVAKSWI